MRGLDNTEAAKSTQVFKARQRSCGKVMFSVMSVCQQIPSSLSTGPPPTPSVQGPVLVPVQTCSNLFKLDLNVQEHPPDMFRLGHYVAHNVGKRAVGIRLKCLLVSI